MAQGTTDQDREKLEEVKSRAHKWLDGQWLITQLEQAWGEIEKELAAASYERKHRIELGSQLTAKREKVKKLREAATFALNCENRGIGVCNSCASWLRQALADTEEE